jgi:hypothetical protein
MTASVKSNKLIISFLKENPASTIEEIAFYTKIPFRMVSGYLFDLKLKHIVSDGILINTKTNLNGEIYSPPTSLIKWTVI